MGYRNIVKDNDPLRTLYKKCRPVTEFNQKLWDLLDDYTCLFLKKQGKVYVYVPGHKLFSFLTVINSSMVTSQGNCLLQDDNHASYTLVGVVDAGASIWLTKSAAFVDNFCHARAFL